MYKLTNSFTVNLQTLAGNQSSHQTQSDTMGLQVSWWMSLDDTLGLG
jgi:hypothetical protein